MLWRLLAHQSGKNYKLRSAKSTSCIFLWLVWFGYAAGVTARVISVFEPSLPTPTWYLLAIYFINLIMVSANLAVYYRNRKLDCTKNSPTKAQ